MNAENFKQVWFEKIRKKLGEKKFIWYLMGDEWESDFAEAYHKSKVEAVSDEKFKEVATKFFYHWWNAKGQNTEQGFDDWWKENKEQLLKQ